MQGEKPQVVIYTTPFCPFCHRAKSLLSSKGVQWEEIDLMEQPDRHGEMLERAQGRHTVPQIFINGTWMGGYDEIAALDRAGELDNLLNIGA